MPTAPTRISVERYRNRIIVYDEPSFGNSIGAAIFDLPIVSQGGLYTPRVQLFGNSLTSVEFHYGDPVLCHPAMNDARLWGENISGGMGVYGGTGYNHPSGWVAPLIYRPVMMMNPMVSGLRNEAHAPTLQNGWVDYGGGFATAKYVLVENEVLLSGMIKSGTTTAATVLFVLPVGYRPIEGAIFTVPMSGGTCQILVKVNGEVSLFSTGSATYTCLDGVRFRVA